jgi:3',5'-cyclic-AMP phosphodiesterase
MNNPESAEATVSFVQITDTHFGPDKNYARHNYASWPCARDLVEIINNLPTKPDFVIHTGDVATQPGVDAYELAAETFANLDMPIYFVVGNHDRAVDIRRYMSAGPCEYLSDEEGLLTYRFEVNGIEFLTIDARAPDEMDPHGLLSDRQLALVSHELGRSQSPLVLFLHFPVIPVGAPWIDTNALIANGNALHEMLVAARDRLRGVFHGHIHMPAETYRDGVLYSCAASSFANFAAWPGDPGLKISIEPPGYSFVHLTLDRTVIRHYSFPRPSA